MKKFIFLILLLILIVPTKAAAKRVYIEYPDNITINDIEYRAFYEDGIFFHTAFVKATNIKTKETVIHDITYIIYFVKDGDGLWKIESF